MLDAIDIDDDGEESIAAACFKNRINNDRLESKYSVKLETSEAELLALQTIAEADAEPAASSASAKPAASSASAEPAASAEHDASTVRSLTVRNPSQATKNAGLVSSKAAATEASASLGAPPAPAFTGTRTSSSPPPSLRHNHYPRIIRWIIRWIIRYSAPPVPTFTGTKTAPEVKKPAGTPRPVKNAEAKAALKESKAAAKAQEKELAKAAKAAKVTKATGKTAAKPAAAKPAKPAAAKPAAAKPTTAKPTANKRTMAKIVAEDEWLPATSRAKAQAWLAGLDDGDSSDEEGDSEENPFTDDKGSRYPKNPQGDSSSDSPHPSDSEDDSPSAFEQNRASNRADQNRPNRESAMSTTTITLDGGPVTFKAIESSALCSAAAEAVPVLPKPLPKAVPKPSWSANEPSESATVVCADCTPITGVRVPLADAEDHGGSGWYCTSLVACQAVRKAFSAGGRKRKDVKYQFG